MTNVQDNRVLGRRGARIMDANETNTVQGGAVHTETACTFEPRAGLDGDQFTGECILH